MDQPDEAGPLAPDLTIAIVGAGPRGLSVLERLCANAPSLGAGLTIRVHLIDPYLGRGGRVWRSDQPERLWMNTVAGAVTLFTDASVRCDGPIEPGPTLYEWATAAGKPLSNDETLGGLVAGTSPLRWSSRRLMGEYLQWFFERTVDRTPPGVSVEAHVTSVVEVTASQQAGRATELVTLADRDEPLVCDRVVFAQGSAGLAPAGARGGPRARVTAAGGTYVSSGVALPEAVEGIESGEPVLVRGLGLTFYDYLQLLTAERGGRFTRVDRRYLSYTPSGAEPRVLVCSPSGVPYRPAPWPSLVRPRMCPVPRGFTERSLLAAVQGADRESAFERVKEMISADVEYAYYAELFDTHPDRVAMAWDDFSGAFLNAEHGGPDRRDLVARAVPAADDVFDLERLADPMRDERFGTLDDLQRWMRSHIAASAQRSMQPKYTADRAAVMGLHRVSALMVDLRRDGLARRDLEIIGATRRWVRAKLQHIAGGAPWPRQEELIALSRAGVVTFLGPVTDVDATGAGLPRCRPVRVAEETGIDFRSLIEARMSDDSVVPGAAPAKLRVSDAGRILTDAGEPSASRYAIGAMTTSPVTNSLPRANANTDFLRRTDRIARSILTGFAHLTTTEEGTWNSPTAVTCSPYSTIS